MDLLRIDLGGRGIERAVVVDFAPFGLNFDLTHYKFTRWTKSTDAGKPRPAFPGDANATP